MSSPAPLPSDSSSLPRRVADSAPSNSGPRLNLALRPSSSLGPFKLGLSLWHTIDYLRSHQSLFPHINLVYDPSSPRLSPVVVTIEPNLNLIFHGTTQRLITIVLDNLAPAPSNLGPADRPVNLIYNGRIIHSAATASSSPTVLTRSSLHQLFGPTYPGWTQSRLHPYAGEASVTTKASKDGGSRQGVQEFVLGYPGVAFAFVKKPTTAAEAGKDMDIDKHHPVSTIYLFSGSDPSMPEEVTLAPSVPSHISANGLASPSMKARGMLSPTSHEPGGSSSLAESERAALDSDAINIRTPCCLDAVIVPNKGMTLHFARSSSSRTPSPLPPVDGAAPPDLIGSSAARSGAVAGDTTTVELLIGITTPQDAMCDLGSPQRIFYKEDDRMKIHAEGGGGGRTQGSGPEGDLADADEHGGSLHDEVSPFFYNYFDLGFDLLFSSDPGVAASTGAAHMATTTGQARLEKIICHTNVPGDALFQRYIRCPWRVVTNPETEEAGGSEQRDPQTAKRNRHGDDDVDVLYRYADDFWESDRARSKVATATTKATGPSRARLAATTTTEGTDATRTRLPGGRGENLSMELDRGTCVEFRGADPVRVPVSALQPGSGHLGRGESEAVGHGRGEGGGRGSRGSRTGGSGATTGGGESGSLVKLDLSTELVGREGLGVVFEVGREGSVVGVVVF